MPSDHTLLQAIAAGDLPSFEAFYERYSDRVYRFALTVGGSMSVAEDATQDTFVHVMENAAAFDASRSDAAIGWVLGVCRNQLRALLRRSHRDSSYAEPDEQVDSHAPPNALADSYEWRRSAEVIAEAMRHLSLEQREVLTLCGLQELDYHSAATILGVPVGTVRSRLSRSRLALRDALSRHIGSTLEEIGTDVR